MAMGQNRGTLVNLKIDGIYGCESPPKYGTIGFDPWPYLKSSMRITSTIHLIGAQELLTERLHQYSELIGKRH